MAPLGTRGGRPFPSEHNPDHFELHDDWSDKLHDTLAASLRSGQRGSVTASGVLDESRYQFGNRASSIGSRAHNHSADIANTANAASRWERDSQETRYGSGTAAQIASNRLSTSAQNSIQKAADNVQSAVDDVRGSVSKTAQSASSATFDAVHEAGQTARQTGQQLRSAASNAAQDTTWSTQRANNAVSGAIHETRDQYERHKPKFGSKQTSSSQNERSAGMGASAGWFKDSESKFQFGHRLPHKMETERGKHEISMEHYRSRFQKNGQTGSSNHGLFDTNGAVGRQFTKHGVVGGTAHAIGGPLASDGAIGRQFSPGGAIGGTVQSTLGDSKRPSGA